MDTIQKGIITLLKSAITGEKLDLPERFDMEEAYPLIRAHSMSTLIYDGAVCCGIDRKHPTMMKLFQNYCRMMMISEGQMEQVERIFRAFDENGIDYMPLKGCKMKALYPKPELRIMGDADILIRGEQYTRIMPIMKALGFDAKHESDHELVWENSKLYVELHKHLIPSYNKDFYGYFGDGWQMAIQNDGCRYTMSTEDEFIFLFTHFAKHYRDGGIGCRHVVDLWVYLRANPNLDENRVKTALEKLQLLEFYSNMRCLIDLWFGDATTDEKTDYMTSFIFSSGSWGTMENRAASISVRDFNKIDSNFIKKFIYIWTRFFPSVETIRYEYPILNKTWMVLPFLWCIRLFKKVFLERGAVKRKLHYISGINPENIQSRQQALEYVGLGYHF